LWLAVVVVVQRMLKAEEPSNKAPMTAYALRKVVMVVSSTRNRKDSQFDDWESTAYVVD